MRSRNCPAVAPQSVDVARASASLARRSLITRAASRFSCCSAKCALRRRVYAVRAVEKRRHRVSSEPRSSRGSPFHSSSRSRSRLAPLRQSLDSASVSASATIASLRTLDSATFWARSALRASRWTSITLARASRRATSPSRSPTACASATCALTVLTDPAASSGASAPDLIRCSSRSTSNASASKRSVKNLSASSGEPSGYWPTDLSPSVVRTKTVPSSDTRPHGESCCALMVAHRSQSRCTHR